MFKKGYKQTQEHKDKIGKANAISLKGHKGYWLGKKRSHETNRKISEANTGKKHSEETKRKMSLVRLGKKLSGETKLKLSRVLRGKSHPNQSGDKHPHWKGGVSKVAGYYYSKARERKMRKRKAEGFHTLADWEDIKKKYSYMCLCCKQQEPFIKLTEDHIIPLMRGGSDNIENIQPLCRSCNSRKYTNTIDYRFNLTCL